jgi:putative hydrolase of the HAD superfamily
MREWFDDAGTAQPRLNPVISLERGELEVADFERHLAEALRLKGSPQIPVEGLLGRMFARFDHAPEMAALVSRAHRSGVRTALLSNSWGNTYQREGWTEMFDAVVISAEVGMRKPEPGIFAHTLELIGLQARECVFVDDLADNVAAAVELGVVGVVHRSYAETAAELDVLFGRVLSA